MLFTMASVGLPGTSGFVGEFLVAARASTRPRAWARWSAPRASSLGAAYMLYLYRRVAFGEQKQCRRRRDARSCRCANVVMLAPIAAAVLWMGVYPESFLAPMRTDIAALDARLARAAPAGDAATA